MELSCGLRLYSLLRVRKWHPWSLRKTTIVFSSIPNSRSVPTMVPTDSSMLAHASVIVRQLLLPIAGEKLEVAGNKRIRIAVGVPLRSHETIAVILEMRFQLGNDQKKRLMRGLAQEPNGALREEIHPIDAGEVNRLTLGVVHVTLIGMRGVLQRIRALPEVIKAAALIGSNGPRRGRMIILGAGQMPLANVIRGVAGLAQRGSQRDGAGSKPQTVLPNPMAVLILPGKEVRARGSAHRLVGNVRPEQRASPRHGIEMRRKTHRVQAIGPQGVPTELVGNDDDDVGWFLVWRLLLPDSLRGASTSNTGNAAATAEPLINSRRVTGWCESPDLSCVLISKTLHVSGVWARRVRSSTKRSAHDLLLPPVGRGSTHQTAHDDFTHLLAFNGLALVIEVNVVVTIELRVFRD